MILQFFISNWILIWSILYYLDIISIPPLIETIYTTLFISTYLLFIFEIKRPVIYIISIFLHLLPLFFVKKYYENDNHKKDIRKTLYYNTLILVIYAILMTYFKKDIILFYKKFMFFVKKNSLYNITKYLFKI